MRNLLTYDQLVAEIRAPLADFSRLPAYEQGVPGLSSDPDLFLREILTCGEPFIDSDGTSYTRFFLPSSFPLADNSILVADRVDDDTGDVEILGYVLD